MKATKATGALAALGLATLATTGAQAAPKSPSRGGSCVHPWQVTYAHGRVSGDTGKVALAVQVKGSKITVAWHAQRGNHFCTITLVEGRGQIFRSTNPMASYTYTDVTANHSNGIKTLTASSRTGR